MTEYNIHYMNRFFSLATISSFLVSIDPLYFTYLVFLSPFLMKVVSFLSPLFLTTSLLLLSVLTTLVPLPLLFRSKEGLCDTLLQSLRPGFDEGSSLVLEDSQVYKIVFDTTPINENQVVDNNNAENEETPDCFLESKKKEENQVDDNNVENEETLDSFLESKKEEENQADDDNVENEETQDGFLESKKEEDNQLDNNAKNEETLDGFLESKKEEGNQPKPNNKVMEEVKRFEALLNMKRVDHTASMRKEREWRRTLACKLFEERHNSSRSNGNVSNSEEGMDLLWETYETETTNIRNNKKKETRMIKKQEYLKVINDGDYDGISSVNDGDYDDDDDDDNARVCCLQALKLSAGKMNLSMGKPSLVKLGKAFKNMGWLHSPGRKHSSKKGYK